MTCSFATQALRLCLCVQNVHVSTLGLLTVGIIQRFAMILQLTSTEIAHVQLRH